MTDRVRARQVWSFEVELELELEVEVEVTEVRELTDLKNGATETTEENGGARHLESVWPRSARCDRR
jgi:hypothetical protein